MATKALMALNPLQDPKNGHILTRAIIDTIQEPLIILDEKLRIIAASRSFYKKFGGNNADTQETLFYELGNGQWNIPQLRTLLEKVIPDHMSIEEYKVVHIFPEPLGKRIMLINAHTVNYKNGRKKMLLAIFDITKQQHLESEKEKLLAQKDLLLQEMRHRIANSLQLIASILILKAGMVKSKETRFQLEDAHNRIMSIAAVQQHLDPLSLEGGKVEVGKYLTVLCESLKKSMIGGRKPISLEVHAEAGMATAEEAIRLGLMTTELVINALKHAFPGGRRGEVVVSYASKGKKWTLIVTDNGIGQSKNAKGDQPGLGSGIVTALASQMDAEITTEKTRLGRKVSIVHK